MPNHTLSFDFAAPAAPKSTAPRNSLSPKSSASPRAAKPASAPAPAKAESAPKKAAIKAAPAPKLAPQPTTVKAKTPVAKAAEKVVKVSPAAAPKAPKTVASKIAAPRETVSTETVSAETVEKPAVKAKRVRAPKNLAAQYGETAGDDKPRPNGEILLEAPKKSRRTAKARAKRHEAMQVDDDLLQRLARVGSASSLVIGEDEEAPAVRRSRKWQIMCGKCRHEQSAKTAAVLCDCCGTILLRDAARLED